MRDRHTIGRRIRRVRNEAGETQIQMAGRLGISRRLLSNWENDRSWPGVLFVADIAEIYGVSCDWLVLGEGAMYRGKRAH